LRKYLKRSKFNAMPAMIGGRGLKGLNLLAIWAGKQELLETGLNF
jgi:hypothetical protein